MRVHRDESRGRGWYRVEEAGINGRPWPGYSGLGDTWYLHDRGNDALAAVYPTADGEDSQEMEVDLTQGGITITSESPLFEKVGFMRRWVEESIRLAAEDRVREGGDDFMEDLAEHLSDLLADGHCGGVDTTPAQVIDAWEALIAGFRDVEAADCEAVDRSRVSERAVGMVRSYAARQRADGIDPARCYCV